MTENLFDCQIAIVGAGPYGLSAAAHLRAAGIEPTVFGDPMNFWANGMPAGMLLRSPREASTISDPHSAFTLEAYEAASGTKPAKRVAWKTLSHTENGFRSDQVAIWIGEASPRFAAMVQDSSSLSLTAQ